MSFKGKSFVVRYWCTLIAVVLLAVAGLTVPSSSVAEAAQIEVKKDQLLLSGEIQKGDLEGLARQVSEAQLAGITSLTLTLNSEGGSFEEGLRLANFVNSNGITTRVGKDAKCLSACAILFLGGSSRTSDEANFETSRVLEAGAALGFHLPYAAPGVGSSPEKLKLDETEAISKLEKVFMQFGVPKALWSKLMYQDANRGVFDATTVEVLELLGVTVEGLPEKQLPVTRQMAENVCVNGYYLAERRLPSVVYTQSIAEIDQLIRNQPIFRQNGLDSEFLLLPTTRRLSESGTLDVVTCRVSNDAVCQGFFWPDAVKVNTEGETQIADLQGCQSGSNIPLSVPPTTRLNDVQNVLDRLSQGPFALLRPQGPDALNGQVPDEHEGDEADIPPQSVEVPTPPTPLPRVAVAARSGVICNANQTFANIRSGPNSKQFQIVATLPNQTTITVVGEARNPETNHPWYEISFASGHGFVDAELVQNTCLVAMPPQLPAVPPVQDERKVVVCNGRGDSANLRNTPNPKTSLVLSKIFNHETLSIVGEANNPESGHLYFKVRFQGVEGFVDSELVSPSCGLSTQIPSAGALPVVAAELPSNVVVCNAKFPITNLRSGPNASLYGVLLELSNNTPVQVLARTSNPVTGSPWMEVIAQGTRGFVDASNVAADCTGVVPVLATKVVCNRSLAVTNMRSGPNKNYSLVAALANDTRAEVLENVNNPETGHPWAKIRALGMEGYIDSDLVADQC